MEIKKRELDARIYFAMKAASMGYSVCFGKKSVIYYYRNFITKGLVFFKSFGPNNTILIDKIKSAGHKLLAWDEEGMTFIPDEYNDRRLYKENFYKFELFFTWGETDHKIIEKYHPKMINKIFKVGNSRIDVLKSPFNELYHNQAKKIKEKYGNFILFPTLFTQSNAASIYDKDVIAALKNQGFKSDSPTVRVFVDLAKQQKEILKVMFKFFERFAKECSNYKLIVRPHPSEKLDFWRNSLKKYNNIEVIFDHENTSSWIAASDLLISTNCTTAIEAFFLGKQSVNFLPFKNEDIEYKLPKNLSYVVRNLEDLLKIIKNKNNEEITNYINNINKKDITKWIDNAFSSCSVEKTIKIIEKNKEISFFYKNKKMDKFSNNFFMPFFRIEKKLRFFYHKLINKSSFIDTLIDQKFPNLTKAEIEFRANFLSKHFENKEFEIKEIYPELFSIEQKIND